MTKKTRRPDWLLLAIIVCFLVQLFCATNVILADGSLGRIRQAVRKNEESKSQPKPPKQTRHDNNETVEDDHDHRREQRRHPRRNHSRFGLSFLSHAPPPVRPVYFSNVVYSSTVHSPPPVLVTSQPVPGSHDYIVPAPAPEPDWVEPAVTSENTGELVMGDSVLYSEPQNEYGDIGDDWFEESYGRFWASVGSDFDDFSKADFGLQFQQRGGIGIESSVFNLREQSDAVRDHVWIGDVNLQFEFLSRPDVRGRMGVGVNWMNDGWGSVAGFNLTAGFDARMNELWTVSGEGDVGSLGDADYFHARLQLGRRLDRAEWINGLDHFNIGGVEINSLFTGIQFRF